MLIPKSVIVVALLSLLSKYLCSAYESDIPLNSATSSSQDTASTAKFSPTVSCAASSCATPITVPYNNEQSRSISHRMTDLPSLDATTSTSLLSVYPTTRPTTAPPPFRPSLHPLAVAAQEPSEIAKVLMQTSDLSYLESYQNVTGISPIQATTENFRKYLDETISHLLGITVTVGNVTARSVIVAEPHFANSSPLLEVTLIHYEITVPSIQLSKAVPSDDMASSFITTLNGYITSGYFANLLSLNSGYSVTVTGFFTALPIATSSAHQGTKKIVSTSFIAGICVVAILLLLVLLFIMTKCLFELRRQLLEKEATYRRENNESDRVTEKSSPSMIFSTV